NRWFSQIHGFCKGESKSFRMVHGYITIAIVYQVVYLIFIHIQINNFYIFFVENRSVKLCMQFFKFFGTSGFNKQLHPFCTTKSLRKCFNEEKGILSRNRAVI